MTTRSALLIASAFPPVTEVGGHRVVALCRHLVGNGWNVSVITPRPMKDAATDTELLAAVPQEVRIVRTAAPDLPLMAARIIKGRGRLRGVPKSSTQGSPQAPESRKAGPKRRVRTLVDWLSWWLHVPDGRTGWLPSAVLAGIREAMRQPPSVIFSSAPVWSGHIAAALVSMITRVPLVADFRDPWAGSTYRKVPYGAHRHFDSALERMVVRQASRITCAWDGIRQHLNLRYGGRRSDISTIWNGYDAESLGAVPTVRFEKEKCVLVHAGSFYGPRSPIPLFQSLEALHQHDPRLADKLSVVLLGSPLHGGKPLEELVSEHQLSGIVRVAGTVPHRESLSLLKGAHVALLFGQSGSESLASVPAKTYEYIGLGKPVLAIGAGTEAHELMERGGCEVWGMNASDTSGIAAAIAQIVERHSRGELHDSQDADGRALFTRDRMARRLEETLDDAIEAKLNRKLLTRPGTV